MDNNIFENFNKLPAEKQEELIVLIRKLLSYYPPEIFAHR